MMCTSIRGVFHDVHLYAYNSRRAGARGPRRLERVLPAVRGLRREGAHRRRVTAAVVPRGVERQRRVKRVCAETEPFKQT